MTIETKKFIEQFNKQNHTHPNDGKNNFLINFDFFKFNEEGSIICKVSQEFLETSEDGLAIALFWENCLDMQIVCDDQCISNFDMASFLYCPHTDLIYCIPYSVSDNFMKRKEVVIYGREPDEEDRKMIEEYF